MASVLTVTTAGKSAENQALANGAALSPIEYIVIGDGIPPDSSEFKNQTALSSPKVQIKVLSIEHPSETVMRFTGSVPIETGVRIREIGLLLKDGTLFAYTSYMVDDDGLWKGPQMGWTLDIIISREEGNSNLTVEYSPLDIGQMSKQIVDDAKTGLDLYLQAYFMKLVELNVGLTKTVFSLQMQINELKMLKRM